VGDWKDFLSDEELWNLTQFVSGSKTQGWKKPGFLKKNPAQWFFWVFWVFIIYLPRRESF
jgi:hypothetical protein